MLFGHHGSVIGAASVDDQYLVDGCRRNFVKDAPDDLPLIKNRDDQGCT
jgi:hypothetical protein